MQNKIRIYVAAPWIARGDAKALATILAEAGYTITMDWWNYEGPALAVERDTEQYAEFLHMCAVKDMRGVRTADVVVLINASKSEGKAVEQGLALAYGLPIIAIGIRGEYSQNVFHYLPNYHWVNGVADVFNKLEELFGRE